MLGQSVPGMSPGPEGPHCFWAEDPDFSKRGDLYGGSSSIQQLSVTPALLVTLGSVLGVEDTRSVGGLQRA